MPYHHHHHMTSHDHCYLPERMLSCSPYDRSLVISVAICCVDLPLTCYIYMYVYVSLAKVQRGSIRRLCQDAEDVEEAFRFPGHLYASVQGSIWNV